MAEQGSSEGLKPKVDTPDSSTQLLKNKYGLHKSSEVETAAKHTQIKTGEKASQDPLARIQNYLDRLDNIINPPALEGQGNFDRKERNLQMLKNDLYDKYVIKPSEVPESYWETQKRIIRERGQGDDLRHVDWEELKKQNTEAIITDQKASLDKWIDYLSSPDVTYPTGFKYYALRSILDMNKFDKEKGIFTQRSKGTVQPFPDLNREALGYVANSLEKKYQPQFNKQEELKKYQERLTKEEEKLTPEEKAERKQDREQFDKLLQTENFSKLYGFAINKVTPASHESMKVTQGKWVKYDQGSDHMLLVKTLEGHATGWCTATSESMAKTQLDGGDFYVYYSLDQDRKPTVPRIAIRMEGNTIGEVRGIAPDQNLDPEVNQVAEDKLKEFPDGELYKKKVSDMKLLTEIESKTRLEQNLTQQELVFLYEINTRIEGFGHYRDPRIKELLATRNPQEDMPAVFGCAESQIAHSLKEINKDTKAYVGALVPDIFDAIGKYNVEHVYTSFPEGKKRRESIEIGGKSVGELEQELEQANIDINEYAKEDMLYSKDFTTLLSSEKLDIVRFKVTELGFSERPTVDQIYARAKELGLELVPAEAGIHYRLKYKDQPVGEWLFMGMKQIINPPHSPCVFELGHSDGRLWLYNGVVDPRSTWGPRGEFVFSIRKSEPKKT